LDGLPVLLVGVGRAVVALIFGGVLKLGAEVSSVVRAEDSLVKKVRTASKRTSCRTHTLFGWLLYQSVRPL